MVKGNGLLQPWDLMEFYQAQV